MRKVLKNIGSGLLRSVLQKNYSQGNYKEVFWIIGDGRSGTTWIADLINYRGTYRKMFEPFHPQLVTGMDIIQPHQYIRPENSDHPLAPLAADVFSGKFLNYRVDSRNRKFHYDGIVIKDIFANLFAKWATRHHPDIRTVLVIRNPFAVALSKARKSDWLWLKDPLLLLSQPQLFQDHLEQHQDFIRREADKKDPLLDQLLIWAIIHYIPLRQFRPGQLKILFYEDVYADPESEISSVFERFSPATRGSGIRISTRLIDKPTRSAGKDSHIAMGTSPVNAWKNEVDAKTIDQGMRILQNFGLENVYAGDSIAAVSGDELLNLVQSRN